jgi:hypothetical protein
MYQKVIKIEVKFVSDGSYDFGNISADGFLEVYDYSKDTLPVTIAVVGLLLMVTLIWLMRMSRNKP